MMLGSIPHSHAQPGAPPPPIPSPDSFMQSESRFDPADEVFYHIMPITWRYGAWKHPVTLMASGFPPMDYRFGNFQGLIDGLPYLQQLGITAVWLNPIFPSPAYHGYQHAEADKVNPWFGDEEEFLQFIAVARRHGIKVYLDIVCYGISQNTPYFQQSRANTGNPLGSMLAYHDKQRGRYTGYSFKTWNGETVGFVNWDLRNQAARDLVISWSKKWLDPNGDGDVSDGVAGYRLDHVWSKYPNAPAGTDGWGYNLDFWREWRTALENVNPAVFTFAEQARWETNGIDLLPVHDAAFTKQIEFAARESLLKEDASALCKAFDSAFDDLRHAPNRTLLGILGDHDVDRLSSAIEANVETHRAREKAAAAILLLGPFTPVIYAGDEIGMLGKEGKFESDANDIPRREPFKWNAVAPAALLPGGGGPGVDPRINPMTNYFALHKPAYDNRYSRDNDTRSVEEQQGKPGSLLETYRQLIRLRRESKPLRRGNYVPLRVSNPGIFAFTRTDAEETVFVIINLTGGTESISLPVPAEQLPEQSRDVRDLIEGKNVSAWQRGREVPKVEIGPYAFRALQVPPERRGY